MVGLHCACFLYVFDIDSDRRACVLSYCLTLTLTKSFQLVPVTTTAAPCLDYTALASLLPQYAPHDRRALVFGCSPCLYLFLDTDTDKELAIRPCDNNGRALVGLNSRFFFLYIFDADSDRRALVFSCSPLRFPQTLTKHLRLHFFSATLTVISWLDSTVHVPLLQLYEIWHWLWQTCFCLYLFHMLALLPCDKEDRIVVGLHCCHFFFLYVFDIDSDWRAFVLLLDSDTATKSFQFVSVTITDVPWLD